MPNENARAPGLIDEQIRRNRRARIGWDLYRGHREIVTNLLLQVGSPGTAICILGAGNCNDLELKRLVQHFRHVELVDLDGEALVEGCNAQGVTTESRIVRSGGVDVTTVGADLDCWLKRGLPIGDNELSSLLVRLKQPSQLQLTQNRFETVVSLGLLTQLIEPVVLALTTNHPHLPEVISSLRRQHWELLLNLTEHSGAALLITEIVSTDTLPELTTVGQSDLAQVVQDAVEQRNFFTGVHPGVLLQSIVQEPQFASQLASVQATAPWIWNFFTRSYACHAIIMRKRGIS